MGEPVPHAKEINIALSAEFEKYILGKQNLNDTVLNSKKLKKKF
jgi:hypothetical protein